MNGINRIVQLSSVLNSLKIGHHLRFSKVKFSTTCALNLRQVVRTEKNGVMTIEGISVPSPRENKVIQFQNQSDHSPDVGDSSVSSCSTALTVFAPEQHANAQNQGSCSLCKLGLPVRHTDVLILSQFVRADGATLPRRVTGLCKEQQRRVTYLVQMAQKAGLMPNLNPCNSNFDPKKRYSWKKFNKYYDEAIIDDFMDPKKKVYKAINGGRRDRIPDPPYP